VNSK
jgi:hypothetical protein